jgi:IclR family acetate operon transcriptional repressor
MSHSVDVAWLPCVTPAAWGSVFVVARCASIPVPAVPRRTASGRVGQRPGTDVVALWPRQRDDDCMRSTKRDDANSVLERVMLILGAFGGNHLELRLSRLVQSTGLPKPTVYRLAGQLEEAGFLERDASTDSYRLGLRLFELGQSAQRQHAIHEAAIPAMQALRAATLGTAHLALLDGTEVVYIEKMPAPGGLALPSRVGDRLPAYCTAVGKALLAWAPGRTVQSVIAGGLTRRTPYTVTAPGYLLRDLAGTRSTGLAYDKEESSVGVVCVAAPVFGPAGVAAALSVSGRTNQLDLARAADAVRAAAATTARTLRRPSTAAAAAVVAEQPVSS